MCAHAVTAAVERTTSGASSQQLKVARKYQLSTQRYRLVCLALLVGIGVAVTFIVLRVTGVIG